MTPVAHLLKQGTLQMSCGAFGGAGMLEADWKHITCPECLSILFRPLEQILPELDVDFENFAACEKDVIGPALEAAGYRLHGTWFTGDGDSFGPLTRCIKTDQGIVVYG